MTRQNEDLAALRQQIDLVDQRLLAAFIERMTLAEAVAACKGRQGVAVRDTERERQILQKVRQQAGPQLAEAAERLYTLLLTLSRERQQALLQTTEEDKGL